MRVLIVGCGYVGLPLGAQLVRQGHLVWGLRRTQQANSEMEAAGITPINADITQPKALAALPQQFDWVVHCVSASGGGAEEYRAVYFEGTRNLIQWLTERPPQKLVYTSSTSVYGQNDGNWVTEDSPAIPASKTGEILISTEQLLQDAAREERVPAVILRAAGIYGPGRGYWLKQFLRGEATIEGKGERWLNMIHRDDLGGAIVTALRGGTPGRIYNACDNEPVTQLTCFQWLAEKLGRELPPSAPEATGAGRKRGVTNKRISNRRLREELGYSFVYPTFREGFSAELNG
ncbi:MAG TPA: SDR family oxidoreductase [Clostridia bacterium]|nr:SDR family oxidoreductase [Clostridia bacterium]